MHDKFVYFTKILFKSPQAKGFRILTDFPRPLAVVLNSYSKATWSLHIQGFYKAI
jgi:hypothetical protein